MKDEDIVKVEQGIALTSKEIEDRQNIIKEIVNVISHINYEIKRTIKNSNCMDWTVIGD